MSGATIELATCYRLAPGVAIRPERFGGLVYRYDNRRLYFLRSHQAVEFVNSLDGSHSLQETLDDFLAARDIPQAMIETLVKTVDAITTIGDSRSGWSVVWMQFMATDIHAVECRACVACDTGYCD